MAQRRDRTNYRINIPICLAGILLILTVISIYLAADIFARYLNNTDAGDAARVATFDVPVTGTNAGAVMAHGAASADAYTITVENRSEVAVRYHVTLTFDQALSGSTAQLDGAAGTVSASAVTFANAGELAPNGGSKSHTLAVQIDWNALAAADWALITAGSTGDTASKTLAFTVTVDVVQVD